MAWCRHCGRTDAPVGRGDWDPTRDRGNEICYGGDNWLRPGEPCRHLTPNARCATEGPATLP